MRIVLLGDSHLSRVRRDLGRLACCAADCAGSAPPQILNAATGGATTADLPQQAADAGLRSDDRVVVSIGTNDAAPWKRVAFERVRAQLDDFLAGLAVARLVYLCPPGFDKVRLRNQGHKANDALALYASAIAGRLSAAGATLVDGHRLVKNLGDAAFADDGMHLTGRGYDAVLPALARALCGKHGG